MGRAVACLLPRHLNWQAFGVDLMNTMNVFTALVALWSVEPTGFETGRAQWTSSATGIGQGVVAPPQGFLLLRKDEVDLLVIIAEHGHSLVRCPRLTEYGAHDSLLGENVDSALFSKQMPTFMPGDDLIVARR